MQRLIRARVRICALALIAILIITIIAIGVLFIGNYYNYIWIGKRFFQSFLSGFTIAISARAQILTLALTI
jgi:hypothetical protein